MKLKWRYLWWLDAIYWIIIGWSAINIGGCVYCLLYPNSQLALNSDGLPSPKSNFIVSIAASVGAICFSIWGLRLGTRRRRLRRLRELMDDYRRSIQ